MTYKDAVGMQKKFCKECVHSCRSCYVVEFAKGIAYALVDDEVKKLKEQSWHEITLLREGHDQ